MSKSKVVDKCREAFEKLPEINAILHNSEFGFNEDINQYYHPNHTEHRLNYAFLMGAWSVWQSRQAEVDDLIVANAEMKSRLNDAYTDGQGSMYAIKQKEIDRLQSQINEMTEVGLSQESALIWKKLCEVSMSNPFHVGDSVQHDVEAWKLPTSTLRVTHIKNLVVAAVDDSGQKFVGNYGCFTLIKRGDSDINLNR